MTTLGPLEAETCRDFVMPRLHEAGWSADQIVEQYPITDGRIVVVRGKHRRGDPLRADYLLEVAPGFPVAVVEAKREYRLPSDGLQQGMRYAELLDLPLAYATNGKGIVEHDFDTGAQTDIAAFPAPSEAWARFQAWKGIRDDGAGGVLLRPFTRQLRNSDGTVKEPRYYQRVAIERALEAILAGRKRVLLTLATGTGKTFVSLQVIWKLTAGQWPAPGRKPRILYLVDRNILVDQPISREFRPVFGDAIWKIQGDIKTGREIYFALYQALADTGDSLGIFRDYPPDYFDLIVVDECHRGSARDDSSWRAILEHFSDAAQVGMTATPLREDNRDTYAYFGAPVYEYSLKQGIDDGFLAPYRVRRVVLSPDAYGWQPDQGQLDLFGREIPPDLYETRHFERVVSLLARTEVAAKHLTEYLKRTDRMAKTIVFCVDSEHADQMRAALHRANSDLTRQYPHYVARIVSVEGDVGKEHLDNFADVESETPVIATTSKLLSTGVDLPTVKNIVLFKPIASMVDFKQIIGRGTRLYPDADKLSFEIIDYSGATALFEDRDFDGPPELVVDEEIDEEGQLVEPTEVREPEPEYTEAGAELAEEDLEDRGARKLYVEQSDVWVAAEGFYLSDPESGKLKLVDYADYVSGHVRRLFANAGELRERWRSPEDRRQIEELFAARGISFAELAERVGHPESDPLDLLVFVAWNGPAVSRRDRANRLRREDAAFLESFVPDARAILEELLEKYAEHGIGQLDDLRILEVPPLTEFGTPVEIAGRFGGPEELQQAVERLEELLYAT
jgi:type I restriction enzyme, R subunit